jgi:hypothetical protein
MFVFDGDHSLDWEAVRSYYEAGRSPRECRDRFGIPLEMWAAAVTRGEIVPRGKRGRPPGETRASVARQLQAGLTQAEIARELGVSKPTVCFHARQLGVPVRPDLSRRFDWAAIRAYYERGHSATECRATFGFGRSAWANAIERGDIRPRPRREPIDAVLASGRPRCRQHVKVRLLADGIKLPRCEECGIDQWRGRPLSLELHHVNGDGLDNRAENLLLLCPNCHSQTDTWGGRNKARRAAA